MLTAKTAEILSAVISLLDVAPKPMPALWMIVSKGPLPRLLASLARFFVSLIERRSPTRTASALGTACLVDAARSALRACSTTEWPWSARILPATWPIPSLEPVMKMRAMLM